MIYVPFCFQIDLKYEIVVFEVNHTDKSLYYIVIGL
jgi:hypothetical protein